MNILGISCFYHDAAAALLVDGQLVAAAEEERFSPQEARLRVSRSWPSSSASSRPASAIGDLDYVVFYEKPFVKFERILTTALQVVPRSWKVFGDAMTTWLLDKLWVKNLIRQELGVAARPHPVQRASPVARRQHVPLLAVRRGGDPHRRRRRRVGDARRSGAASGTDITLLREIRFPHSLGLLYSAFTAFLGFEVNEGEYKVMGMAPYGDAALRRQGLQAHQRSTRDGSFWLDMDYFCFHHSSTRTYNQQVRRPVRRAARSGVALLHRELRAIRRTSATSRRTSTSWRERNQYYADVAASIQQVHRGDRAQHGARAARARPGSTSSAWPAAWRSTASPTGASSGRRRSSEVFIQPAAGDGGGALGAALYAYHCVLGKPRSFVHGARLLGPGVQRGRDRRLRCAARHRRTRRYANEDELLDARRRAAAGRARDRLVPGPLRVGAARARRAQHHRRPAPRRHEGDRQRQDQVPRAVPPVRAVGAGRERRALLRPARRAARTTRRASCCTSST